MFNIIEYKILIQTAMLVSYNILILLFVYISFVGVIHL